MHEIVNTTNESQLKLYVIHQTLKLYRYNTVDIVCERITTDEIYTQAWAYLGIVRGRKIFVNVQHFPQIKCLHI